MSDFENSPNNEIENVDGPQKRHNWMLLFFISSAVAFLLLCGIWYVNNERAFLAIENNRLQAEAEKLREEIRTIQAGVDQQTGVDQNGASVQEPASEEEEDKPAENTSDGYTSYTVKAGDTLSGISVSLYGTERYVSRIAELNGITPESILQLGQTLKVPNKPGE